MMVCAMEPDKRWDAFQQNLAERVAALPPPPVSVAWDPENADVVGEQLMAAIYRDGTAILTKAVSEETCSNVVADMMPYMDAAAERATLQHGVYFSVENRSTRVTALPTRSENSWEMITHPAIIDVGNALLGRQILDMDKSEVSRRMGGRAKQVTRHYLLQHSTAALVHRYTINRRLPDCTKGCVRYVLFALGTVEHAPLTDGPD